MFIKGVMVHVIIPNGTDTRNKYTQPDKEYQSPWNPTNVQPGQQQRII